MQETVLNRLIAARFLLDSSGPLPNSTSPALVLTQKLVVAYDAAELVFLAMLALTNKSVLAKDGQVVKDPSFHALAEAVLREAELHKNFQSSSKLRLFDDLSEARKLFKHSGILVDPLSNANLFQESVRALDEVCLTLAGQSFREVDQASVVENEEAREYFSQSRRSIEEGEYKTSLEQTARGLASCFWAARALSTLSAGRASSEEALLLSGRGVDPASFIAMQRLLPLTYASFEEPEWDLRKFGHPGNWTEDAARFCLRTAVDVATRLQCAPFRPDARDFYDCYEDVIEILGANTEVTVVQSSVFSLYRQERKVVLGPGEKLFGRAVARLEMEQSSTDTSEMGFEYALWVEIKQPRHECVSEPQPPSMQTSLWVQRDAVRIYYQVNKWKAKLWRHPDLSIEAILAIPDDEQDEM